MDARLAISLAALLIVPYAAAQESGAVEPMVDGVLEAERCLEASAAPPCGYILPTIDIVVEGKLACGGGRLIYAEGPPDDCEPIMADGESKVYDAMFLWYWEMSEDGTYPKEAGEDIEISFSGTASNPKWLLVAVAGEGMVDGKFIIDDVALVHPDNIYTDDSSGTTRVWFSYERPITITFTRDGSPQDAEIDRIDARHAVPAFFLKAKSTASEPRFKEAFGVEEFRFNTCADPDIAAQLRSCGAALAHSNEQAPGLTPLFALLALAGLALRRRQ